MLGDNFVCVGCCIFQYWTENSCCDPLLVSKFHNTVADVDLHTTKTTLGAVF